MGKRKSRQSRHGNSRPIVNSTRNFLREGQKLEVENLHRLRQRSYDYWLTRGLSTIANRDGRLSLADDLRRTEDLRDKNPFHYDSQGRKFRNLDGTVAETTYKKEPVKKKIFDILLLGVMSLVFAILIRLLFANVEINANKYFSLLKFW